MPAIYGYLPEGDLRRGMKDLTDEREGPKLESERCSCQGAPCCRPKTYRRLAEWRRKAIDPMSIAPIASVGYYF